MKYFVILFFSILILGGCASEAHSPPLRPEMRLPYSHGRPNQILVIADSTVWQGMAGDTFYYYFSAPYLLMPQPEPIFDIIYMTPEELAKNPAKKEFKSILFLADMNDLNSITSNQVCKDVGDIKIAEARRDKGYTTIVGQNKWARDQVLFYIIGMGEEKLAENISGNFAPMARRINERDMEMVEANAYQSGINADVQADILASYGVNMKIPGDFKKILHNTASNTTWYRSDDRDIVANILVHKRPYKSKDQLSYDGIKGIRDEVGKSLLLNSPTAICESMTWIFRCLLKTK